MQADEAQIIARANIDSAYERQSIDTEDLFWWTEKDERGRHGDACRR